MRICVLLKRSKSGPSFSTSHRAQREPGLLFHGGIKSDFMEAWWGIQWGSCIERKLYKNDPRCHSHDFWLLTVCCRRDGELSSLVMYHECNIWNGNEALTQNWESLHPIKKNGCVVVFLTRWQRTYCVARTVNMHAFLQFFLGSIGGMYRMKVWDAWRYCEQICGVLLEKGRMSTGQNGNRWEHDDVIWTLNVNGKEVEGAQKNNHV